MKEQKSIYEMTNYELMFILDPALEDDKKELPIPSTFDDAIKKAKEVAEEEILKERTLEFVAEGKRWYDVRRMAGGKHALALVNNDKLKLLWPIDSGVLSKDSKVTQNQGYK